MRDLTVANELRIIADADPVLRGRLTRIADRLDAAAAIIITADPDQNEAVALALGDPEANAEVADRSAVALATDYELCHCRTLPQEQRLTGHHPDCAFWDAKASAE